MKRPFLFHPYQAKSAASLIGLTIFFLLFMLACGGGGEEAPAEGEAAPEAAAVPSGTLVCSEECAAKGQCGQAANGGQSVILGHPERPVVENHQMTFQAEYTLPILETRDALVRVVATGEQFPHTFYRLQRADGQTGWVPGWCLNPQ